MIVLLPIFVGSESRAQNDEMAGVAESLKKAYPKIRVDEVSKTDMEGIYEMQSEGNIFYYHPKTGTLFLGDLVRDKRSLTEARRNSIGSKLVKNLPLEKAVKIGNGRKMVVEFSDPDCPFCRKADEYLSKRGDVTVNLFLYPLPNHRDARKKSLQILCSADQAKAYKEVMAGKLDQPFELSAGCESKNSSTLEQHLAWGQKLGVSGTPAFWINGERVEGANIPEIERLLSAQK